MKPLSAFLACVAAAIAASSCDSPARSPAPDTVPPAVRRVVSVAPGATEILFALGAGDRVVGGTEFCTHPPAARAKPSVGGYRTPSAERILGLEPDLVIYVRSIVRDAAGFEAGLRAAGIRTLPLELRGIAGVYEAIRRTADAVGTDGTELIARLRSGVEAASARFAERPRRRVLVVVSRDPAALYVAGRDTFIAEMVARAGGVNAASARAGYYPMSGEALLAADPDVIVDAGGPMESGAAVRRTSGELWERFDALRAVREGRVRVVTRNALVVPGPRLPEALRRLGRAIHGPAGEEAAP